MAEARNVLPLIAATAQVHGLTGGTRNVAGFQVLGAEMFNPLAT